MEKNKKIKLIFDGIIIQNGAYKSNSRSGIYFVAMNILKQFLERDDFDISIYCSYQRLSALKAALKTDFKGVDFNIISNISLDFIIKIYLFFSQYRIFAKNNGNKILKFIIDIVSTPFKLYLELKTRFQKNKKLNVDDFDVYFSFANKIPSVILENKNIKKFTILHDAIPYLFPNLSKDYVDGGWFKDLVDTINKDDYYFAVSENTRRDFLKIAPQIDENKIHTTLLACDEKFKPVDSNKINEIKKKYNIPLNKKYIFSLCTIDPRKNLVRAIRTYIDFIKKHNIDDLCFVLGGGHFKNFIKEFEKEVMNISELKDKIIKIGYVDDIDLPILYSGAHFFVYTSQYEGFGLPPIEAMSCGCPVITSNNSSLPEVVGDAAIMINYDDDSAHIESYEKYYFDENLRNENIKKGLERAKEFSWEKCADTMAQVIKKAVDKN